MTETRTMSLSRQTANRIIEYIKTNRLEEGTKLPAERELSVIMGVSRTTIREALKNLGTMGYIESKHGHGTFVKKPDFETFIDPLSVSINDNVKMKLELLEVREMLECETAKLAALRIDDYGKKEIKKALEQMKSEVAAGETGINGDSEFHQAIAKATKNDSLKSMLEMCRDILNTTRNSTLDTKKKREEAIRDHKKIAKAIFEGDSDAAQAEMKKHIEAAYKNINLAKK